MSKYRITNTSDVDKCVDLAGNNKVEDKVIIHPKRSVVADLSQEVLNALKSTTGLSLVPAK